jgi:hypothetical protein
MHKTVHFCDIFINAHSYQLHLDNKLDYFGLNRALKNLSKTLPVK